MRLATVFSGIGAVEQACFKVFGKDETKIVFACDNGEINLNEDEKSIKKGLRGLTQRKKQEIVKMLYAETGEENAVKDIYIKNYKIPESKWYDDIRFFSGKRFKGKVDLFMGGSPCQSFSMMGKRGGLNDTRGTLFYEYARLVKEIGPKVFIYENVPGMLSIDGGQTWAIIKNIFCSLGYAINEQILNSKDYGMPQDRRRLFVIGIKGINSEKFVFPKPKPLDGLTASDFLDKKIPPKYYLGQKGFEFIVTHPNRASINRPIIRTEKANQQFNWNGDFIFEPESDLSLKAGHKTALLNGAFLGEYKGKKGFIRKLTPRECLRLMGFDDLKIDGFKDERVYRLSGNSIVVNVLTAILSKLKDDGTLE